MPSDIGQWLARLGLGEYAERFVENGIDLSVLPHITDRELKDIGVALGARRKIQLSLGPTAGARRGDEPEAAPPESAAADAERRQVTVMFCDLVGATALSARLDPEDYRETIRSYQDACAGEVVRYDGYVAQFLGDGVLAYFGWPRAHEDDAARAIHAGLAIIAAIGQSDVPTGRSEPLHVRVGIATGPVVIGDVVGTGSAQQAAATGETPNRAARVQGLAHPDTILVDAETRALASGLFDCQALGPTLMKGIDGAPEVWRIVCGRRVESRFAASRSETLTPLVGRDEELALLVRRWKQAEAGRGAVVLIAGEAGIGKSRLTQALDDAIGEDSHGRLLFQCSARHTNSALFPVISQLEFAAGFAPDDDADVRLDRLEALLGQAGPPCGDLVPLIAALLSIPASERHPLPELTPPQRRERTLSALVDHVVALAKNAALLLVIEDAHWIDPTSLELLERLIQGVRELPVLMLVTYRPEFTAPWVGEDHVTLQALSRLTRRQRARMAEQLTGTGTLSSEVIDQIAERSDGIPLFIEELARSAREASADRGADPGRRSEMPIPPTLHDALEARFDRSPEIREVAQVGAAIGREFGYGLLARVVSLSSVDLEAALAELTGSGLLFARGAPPDARYTFKHALIQDTAYGTLLRSKRSALHARLADALRGSLPVEEVSAPEVVAHHYTEAGDVERAVSSWQEAGRRAVQRSDCVEATAHLERALELVRGLPDTRRRSAIELDLLMTLSPALIFIKGMGSDEVGALHERAIELANATGDRERSFRALFGSWIHAVQHPPLARAQRTAERLDAIAKATHDAGHQLQAHHALWTTAYFAGDLAASHRHSSEGTRLYDLHTHGQHAQIYGGHDPGSCALNFGSQCVWLMGYPEQAMRKSEASLALAERLGHRVSEALAHCWNAICHLIERDPARARTAANRAVEIAEQYELSFLHSFLLLRGLAEVALESKRPVNPSVLALMRNPSTTGLEWFLRPYGLALFARTQADAGRADEAKSLLEEASEYLETNGSGWCEAEVRRQRGEVLRIGADGSRDAEACFEQALDLARRQGSKAWELRAATSLARLRRDQGKPRHARELLAPVYDWFTEGFDTLALREAKALLDELA